MVEGGSLKVCLRIMNKTLDQTQRRAGKCAILRWDLMKDQRKVLSAVWARYCLALNVTSTALHHTAAFTVS